MKYRSLIFILLLSVMILCSCVSEHTHAFPGQYTSDEDYHWFECECGEKNAQAEHSWNNGIITLHPTADSEGIMTYTCTVCRYKKEEKIDKLETIHTCVYDVAHYDEYTHWFECVCGKTAGGTSAHRLDSGVVTTPATSVEMGIKTFTCLDCGYKSTQTIPSTGGTGLSFKQSVHHRISNKLAATPLTIEAEIYVPKTQSARVGAIFGNYNGVRENWLFEIYTNGVPRFYYNDSTDAVKDIRFDQVDVRTGDWAHVALTFDFAQHTISLYLNGNLAQTVACDLDLTDDITRYEFVLGGDNRSNNGNYFQAQMRSLAVYSDVRTAQEIAKSANNGININADDILAAYLLNSNSAGKDIIDLTGNGYDIPKEWIDSHAPSIDYAYSFAVIGDTQWLSYYKPDEMETIYDWLLANKTTKKIAHVFGLGDITEKWNPADKEQEWIRAHEYISKLNGVIPYTLIRGNHDESKYLNKYFATNEYLSQLNGVLMKENEINNAYKLVTIGSTDYLFLMLDYAPSDEMLEWANEVVVAHPNHRVIVTTHAYHGYDGGHLNPDNVNDGGDTSAAGTDVDTSVNGGVAVRDHNNGQAIWEKFVSKHPNIFLVLSGHTPMEDIFVLESEGVHGNIVKQMLVDPQWMDPQKDGVGMVCMLYFTADGSQMEVEWISAETGKYYKEMNQFQLDISDAINNPSHDFHSSYNGTHHYVECSECGYVYGEESHYYGAGVINASGLMEYTCKCGYKRVTSVTNDPIALELQALLEKYYNEGKYFRDTASTTTYFNGSKFWTTDDSNYENTQDYLTLYDLMLGKYGNIKLDQGWNCTDGVYYSSNADTIKGFRMFALGLKTAEASAITKVSVEQLDSLLIIKLWTGDSVTVQTTVGLYATFTLVNHDGETLGVEYVKSGYDGLCRFSAPKKSGLVPEYDYLNLSVKHDSLEKTVYYSEVDTWDGTSVSTGLSGEGTKESPYLIQSAADLAYIAKTVNGGANFNGKYFKMTKSIDLGGRELRIGLYSASRSFHGYFDGNNCSIRGINNTQSLFGMLQNGYIKNLSLYGTVTTSEAKGVAGLVSYVSNATVENITNYVNVTGVQQVAGIVGWLENSTTAFAINCVNYGNINATSYQIGGVAGFAKGSLSGCRNFGNVTSTGSGYVGGIGGAAKDAKGSRSDCVNYGNISGTSYVGGCFGQITATTTDCYSYGTAIAPSNVGEVVGSGASNLTYTAE